MLQTETQRPQNCRRTLGRRLGTFCCQRAVSTPLGEISVSRRGECVVFSLNILLIVSQISTCHSNLHAVDHANLRGHQKLLANGIGGVCCARHVVSRPLSFGDIQRGERCVLNLYYAIYTSHCATDTLIWTILSCLRCMRCS